MNVLLTKLSWTVKMKKLNIWTMTPRKEVVKADVYTLESHLCYGCSSKANKTNTLFAYFWPVAFIWQEENDYNNNNVTSIFANMDVTKLLMQSFFFAR